MVAASSEIVSVGVDYVTATKITSGHVTELEERATEWLYDEREAGNDICQFSAHGYSGLRAGGIAVATNGYRLLVKVSGAEAQTYAPTIIQHADSVSRFDVQATVRFSSPTLSFCERMERAAQRHKHKQHLKHQIQLLRNDVTGKTLYLGRRTSERMTRIYDKGAESQLPELAGCWRAETQYGKPLSMSRSAQFLENPSKPEWLLSVICFELVRLGIRWKALLDGSVLEQPTETNRKLTTVDQKLSWLSEQVRPSVEWLRDRGKLQEALSALGVNSDV